MTTADVIKTPRSKQPAEFDVWCAHCAGPLVLLTGRAVPAYVHARHGDWQADPHTAVPLPF